ncbi:MAG: DUF1826 domain-containing protein [Chloroherpetonaceae bacterium]
MIATESLHIAIGNQREVLEEIHDSNCNLAIWKRKPDANIVAFLQRHAHEELHLCQTLRASEVKAYLRDKMRKFEDEAGKWALFDDVAQTANFFAHLTNANKLHLHLEIIRTDQCRKFHRDFYPLRLLCTYLGKGTEYLENDNVNRDGETNDEIVCDWCKVKRLNAFEVAILKGEHGENVGKAIFHRSPPIEATNEFRVLLRIDV